NFCFVGGAIALGGLLAIPQLPGGYLTTRLFLVGIAVSVLGLFYLYYRTLRPETYHEGWGVAVGWYIPILGVSTSVPFFGPFSPVPILLVLGIYFNGLGASVFIALATYVTCAAAQGLTAALIVFGVIDDPGFIHANYLPFKVQLMSQGLVQMVLLGTYIISRASRASSLAALRE